MARSAIKLIVTLSLHISMSAAAADEASWRLRLPVFLTAGAYVQETADSTISYNALSAFVELRLWSPCRPWSTSMFFDYRVSRDKGVADALKKGILFRHRNGEWDTLAAVFRSHPRGGPSASGYAGRIRYRLAGNHKIGVESFGNHGQLDTSYLMLGYYGDLSPALSLQLVAGSNVGNRRDRAARVEIVWQVN